MIETIRIKLISNDKFLEEHYGLIKNGIYLASPVYANKNVRGRYLKGYKVGSLTGRGDVFLKLEEVEVIKN